MGPDARADVVAFLDDICVRVKDILRVMMIRYSFNCNRMCIDTHSYPSGSSSERIQQSIHVGILYTAK